MDRHTDAGTVFETRHRCSSTLSYHRHDTCFATIVLRGSYTEVRDDVPQLCARGSLVVHGTSEVHADHFLGDARCLNVELPYGNCASGVVEIDAMLQPVVERIVRSFYDDSPGLHAAVVELQALLRDRRNAPATFPPGWLEPVLDLFDWCDAVPLRAAAEMAGVHPVQFSRVFHRHVGMTSSEYRRHVRLRRASELLLVSTSPLAQIAQNCGFADQSHFTRTFTERLGLSPAHYRHVFAR